MDKERDGRERKRTRQRREIVKHGRDRVSEMLLLRSRPDLLASALREMGYSESGDNFPADE